VDIMKTKALSRLVRLEEVPTTAANILKQEMLAADGEAATSIGSISGQIDKTDVLLMGTLTCYRRLLRKLERQPYGLAEIAAELEEVLNAYATEEFVLQCGRYTLNLGKRTCIMGVLNVTPDSFSDGGRFLTEEAAVARAKEMVEDGADVIDVGGESTRPGAPAVDASEELRRIEPIIKRLVREVNVPISVDTTKAEVAERMLGVGADMLNDISGFTFDPTLADVVARYGVAVIVGHTPGRPDVMQEHGPYRCLMGEVVRSLRASISWGMAQGISADRFMVDPGIGFGKDLADNLEILTRLGELRSLGRPIVVGPSRKAFIGKILDLPVEERLEGTAPAVAAAILFGGHVVRVHDVKEMVRVARVSDAIAHGTSAL